MKQNHYSLQDCFISTKQFFPLLKPIDWIVLVCGENQMIFYFFSLKNNCIVLCELLMPGQLFAQKCSNFQEITKISKFLESPEHSAIGNIHRDMLLLGIISTCHSKQLPVGLIVLSDGMVHFLKIEKKIYKSTKTILSL